MSEQVWLVMFNTGEGGDKQMIHHSVHKSKDGAKDEKHRINEVLKKHGLGLDHPCSIQDWTNKIHTEEWQAENLPEPDYTGAWVEVTGPFPLMP